MAPSVVLGGAESWSMGTTPYVVNLDLFYAMSFLLLVLLLISCGTCMRKSAGFSTYSSYTEDKDNSQLLRVTQIDDAHLKVICNPTLREGSLHSRKVSWQNEMPHEPASVQQGRALPEIPGSSASKEDLEGKGDPVYQMASDLETPSRNVEEEAVELPYATSNHFSLEAPEDVLLLEEEVAEQETRKADTEPDKVMALYARVSKKVKNSPALDPPNPSTPHESKEFEEQPPPVPEKLFDDGDMVMSEASGNQRSEPGCRATGDPSMAPSEAGSEGGVQADPEPDRDRG